jgi:ABC-type nitrate/sulfonate/bicarbonate transport system permease component
VKARAVGRLALSLAGVAAVVALWELAPRVGWVRSTSLPPFSEVMRELGRLVGRPGFGTALLDSGRRWAAGLVLAATAGILLGIAMGRRRWLSRLVDPLLALAYPVPKAALVLLFVPWWGAGSVSRVGIVVAGALIPIVISAYHGAQAVDERVVWSARSLGTSRIGTWARVVLPGSLPQLLPGLRLAIGISIFTLLGSELLIRGEGVGAYLFTALDNGQTLTVFATSTVIACLGFLLDTAFVLAVSRTLRWIEVDW